MTGRYSKGSRASIGVLLVDDSGFMRMALRKMLEQDPCIRILGEATTGEDAIRMARQCQPDIITMDVQMPGTDGVEATRRIMEMLPGTAIIMVSSVTRAAAKVTLEAIEAGAVDFISKASSYVDINILDIERQLLERIHFWSSNVRAASPGLRPAGPQPERPPRSTQTPELVVIGASTGGPRVIPEILRKLPPFCCPVVIAVHMPAPYTESFARHLDQTSAHSVVEARDGMRLSEGLVAIAPGGVNTRVVRTADDAFRIRLEREADPGLCPSVDVLFESAARQARAPLAIVLTGMGEDGRKGALALAEQGFPVLAQCASDCLVYGMPRAVVEAGAASESLTPEQIRRHLARRVCQQPSIGKQRGRDHVDA